MRSFYLTKMSSFQLCMKRMSKMYMSSSWLRMPTKASEIHFLIHRSSFPKRSWSFGFQSFFLFLLRSFQALLDLSGLERRTSGTTVWRREVAWMLKKESSSKYYYLKHFLPHVQHFHWRKTSILIFILNIFTILIFTKWFKWRKLILRLS